MKPNIYKAYHAFEGEFVVELNGVDLDQNTPGPIKLVEYSAYQKAVDALKKYADGSHWFATEADEDGTTLEGALAREALKELGEL